MLRTCFRKEDILIRMGGDEFAVSAPGKWNETQIQARLSSMLEKMEKIHFSDGRKKIAMTASIGCAYTPDRLVEPDEMLWQDDQEMYRIKKNGKGSFSIVKTEKEAL